MGDFEWLLMLVKKTLPLGKDVSERLALSYNANRHRGVPDMPSHIKKAKEVRQAIDEKASVGELDDGVDDDQRGIERRLLRGGSRRHIL
ncbi:hypothetical protein PInf_006724 [Phytophthora infestans]|nr:hypothetical protein PInf_006724 [Phytophthora infestans]